MDRVFLDANVLFSAAYRETNGLLRLWQLAEVELITSAYACNEAARNLGSDERLNKLTSLLAKTSIVDEPDSNLLPPAGVNLPNKDLPILMAAIQTRATHLLTGDKTHFGPLFGQAVDNVLIETPGTFLAARFPSNP